MGGGLVWMLNGCGYAPVSREEQAAAEREVRADGRARVPPGQQVIRKLKDMGGERGNSDPAALSLRLHGRVRRPLELDYRALLEGPVEEQSLDVHCVTGWSALGQVWTGIPLAELADRAGVLSTARHVVFEAAHGYTANVPLREALAPQVLIAWRLNGDPLAHAHGGPVRNVVPDLYFWKSAKWLTGIRFLAEDEPGYWEVRGYHNHGDPWKEERYS